MVCASELRKAAPMPQTSCALPSCTVVALATVPGLQAAGSDEMRRRPLWVDKIDQRERQVGRIPREHLRGEDGSLRA